MSSRSTSRNGGFQTAEAFRGGVGKRPSLIGLTAIAAATSLFAESPVAPANADWHQDAPGVRHKFTAAELAAPYATKSVDNGPREVRPPEGAQPKVPPGFKIEQYA